MWQDLGFVAESKACWRTNFQKKISFSTLDVSLWIVFLFLFFAFLFHSYYQEFVWHTQSPPTPLICTTTLWGRLDGEMVDPSHELYDGEGIWTPDPKPAAPTAPPPRQKQAGLPLRPFEECCRPSLEYWVLIGCCFVLLWQQVHSLRCHSNWVDQLSKRDSALLPVPFHS